MTSERQQDGMACGGNFGGAGVTMVEAESRADVGQLGFELRAEARSTADVQAFYSRMQWKALEWEQARRWRDEAVARRGAGAASSFPGSRADVARVEGTVAAQHLCSLSSIGRSTENGGCVGSMENELQQGEAVSGGSGGADAASCFPGPELQVGSRADVTQAGTTTGDGGNRFMGSERQQGEVVSEGGNGRPGVACYFQGPELRGGSQANVAQGSVAADDGLIGGLLGHVLGGERRQGEAVQGSGSGGADAACRFLGSELRVESRAGGGRPAVGAQRLCSPAGAGEKEDGGTTARAQSMAGRAGDEGAGAAETAQAKCARLRAEAQALFETDRRWEEERKWGREEATNRRWEARWRAREAKEQAARVQRLAAQDQGSKARPAQAGPCAACARQGGICGFCRERQRLAC